MACPAVDALEPLRVGRSRVAERDDVTGVGEDADEVEDAVELGRNRDDGNLAARSGNLVEDVLAGKRAARRVESIARRQSKAFDRLCAPIVGVDEVALEMRAKHRGLAAAR